MSDHMEMGDSGMVPQADGWFLDTKTGNRIDSGGRVFDQDGEMIWDPALNVDEEDYERG